LQYEYEAKQSQFKLQQERKLNAVKLENQKKNAFKNNLLIGLSFVLLLLFAIGYFLNKSNKQKQAIAQFEKNELNQKLLLSQMNPHFIFNSIDNIQSLIYNKQDKEAVNYLTKFSKLTRQILENSNESYIAFSEEVTMMDNYLVIQQLLYNNKFDFTIEVGDAVDAENILVPPMLTQPFIENAIKHGLKNATAKGEIHISFKWFDDKLFFEITDNGVGFTTNEATNKKSLAMKITKERLKTISKRSDFEVQIENRYDAKNNVVGAKVFFEIPYIYEK
jgi:LytS/YehU family sensor histidine kinase